MSTINNVMKDCIKLVDLLEQFEEFDVWNEDQIANIIFVIDGIYSSDNYKEQFDKLVKLAKNENLNELFYILNNKLISLWEEYSTMLISNEHFSNFYNVKEILSYWKEKVEECYKNKSLRGTGIYDSIDSVFCSYRANDSFSRFHSTIDNVYPNLAKMIISFRTKKMFNVINEYTLNLRGRLIGNLSFDSEERKKNEKMCREDLDKSTFITRNETIAKELYFVIKNKKWKKKWCIKCGGVTAEEIASIICKDKEVNYIDVYAILTSLWNHKENEGKDGYYNETN